MKQFNKSNTLTLENFLILFQQTQEYFTKNIQKQVLSKRKSTCQLQIEAIKKSQTICFHPLQQFQIVYQSENKYIFLQNGQRQLLFQQALKFIRRLIQKFQIKTGYKKSNDIKKFLIRVFIYLSKILVEKVCQNQNQYQHKFQIYLEKIYIILFGLGQQINTKNTKKKGKKTLQQKQSFKNLNFEVPLILSNKKIDFRFYLMMKLYEQQLQKLYKSTNNIVKSIQYLCSQIQNFIEILITKQKHQILSLFIKSVCNCLECFELPIIYLFFGEICLNLQNRFSTQYDKFNKKDINLHRLNANKEIFSFDNMQILLESLGKIQRNSFSQIKMDNYLLGDQQKQQIINQDKIIKCSFCDVDPDKYITLRLQNSQNKNSLQNKQNQFKVNVCQCCIQQFFSRKKYDILQPNLIYNLIQQKSFQKELLITYASKIYWQQQFELKSLKKNQYTHFLLLSFLKDKVQFQSLNLMSNVKKQILQQNYSVKILKMIYIQGFYDLPSKQKNKKLNSNIGIQKQRFLLSKIFQKLLTIVIAFINSQSEYFRQKIFNILQSNEIINSFCVYFGKDQFQQIFNQQNQDISQVSLKNINNNNLSTCQQIVFKVNILIKISFDRFNDSSNIVRINSLVFLLKLNSKFKSIKVKEKIFNKIIQICMNILLKIRNQALTLERNNSQIVDIAKIFLILFQQCNNIKFSHSDSYQIFQQNKKIFTQFLQLIFTFLSTQFNLKLNIFNSEEVSQLVNFSHELLKKIIQINNFEKEIFESTDNNLSLQLQNITIAYINRFNFTNETIKCFIISNNVLQKLIKQCGLIRNQQDDYQIDSNNQIILFNLKIILEELFDFPQFSKKQDVLKNKKSKANKQKQILQYDQNNQQNDNKSSSFYIKNNNQINLSCDLNKLIRNLVIGNNNPNLITCQILTILLKKNIFIGYESSNYQNFTRLKVYPQIFNKLTQITIFLQKQITECNIDHLKIYIKLYISINKQLNKQQDIKKILHIYNKFYVIKSNRYFDFNNDGLIYNSKMQKFLIRTLITISEMVTQLQCYRKIQNSLYNQIDKNRKKKINIQPQFYFNGLQQTLYQAIKFFIENKNNINFVKHLNLINTYLKVFYHLLTIHEIPMKRTYKLVNLITLQIKQILNKESYQTYILLFQIVLGLKKSHFTNQIIALYSLLKKDIFKSFNNFEREGSLNLYYMQKFYEITFTLLKEDAISIHQVIPQIFYGFFINNKKINFQCKEFLKFANKKGTDGILLTNFDNSITQCYQNLWQNDNLFFTKSINFKNIKGLSEINKFQQKSMKIILIKDLKDMKIRLTFVKKISEFIDRKGSILTFNTSSIEILYFIFKILENLTEIDKYQFQQLIYTLQKFIKQNYLQAFRHLNDQTQKQIRLTILQSLSQKQIQNKIYKVSIIGQCMYLMICLLNEKKLKKVKKQVQNQIQKKKFTGQSIYIKINSIKNNEGDINHNTKRYQSCVKFIEIVRTIEKTENFNYKLQLIQILLAAEQLVERMYGILFNDQNPRIVANFHQEKSKKQTKKRLYEGQTDSQDQSQDQNQSEESQIQFSDASNTLSFSQITQNKITKKMNPKSRQNKKNDFKQTKKNIIKNKINSTSLPKKVERGLGVIIQKYQQKETVENVDYPRRSKRLAISKKKCVALDLQTQFQNNY